MVEETRLIWSKSAAVSLTATEAKFSSSRESLRVPKTGTIHGFWASSQRDLRWRCPVPLSDGAEKIDYPDLLFVPRA
jgi:hypothetical protein